MALVLDATPGGASANSYCTAAEADAYHEARLHNEDWQTNADGTPVTTAQKEAALVWATRLLDELVEWDGLRVDTTQALEWPRLGVYKPNGEGWPTTEIPQWLKNATAELARHLLAEDRAAEGIPRNLRGIDISGVLSLDLAPGAGNQRDIIPPSVWGMIQRWGWPRNPGSMAKLERT